MEAIRRFGAIRRVEHEVVHRNSGPATHEFERTEPRIVTVGPGAGLGQKHIGRKSTSERAIDREEAVNALDGRLRLRGRRGWGWHRKTMKEKGENALTHHEVELDGVFLSGDRSVVDREGQMRQYFRTALTSSAGELSGIGETGIKSGRRLTAGLVYVMSECDEHDDLGVLAPYVVGRVGLRKVEMRKNICRSAGLAIVGGNNELPAGCHKPLRNNQPTQYVAKHIVHTARSVDEGARILIMVALWIFSGRPTGLKFKELLQEQFASPRPTVDGTVRDPIALFGLHVSIPGVGKGPRNEVVARALKIALADGHYWTEREAYMTLCLHPSLTPIPHHSLSLVKRIEHAPLNRPVYTSQAEDSIEYQYLLNIPEVDLSMIAPHRSRQEHDGVCLSIISFLMLGTVDIEHHPDFLALSDGFNACVEAFGGQERLHHILEVMTMRSSSSCMSRGCNTQFHRGCEKWTSNKRCGRRHLDCGWLSLPVDMIISNVDTLFRGLPAATADVEQIES
ncbi:hypothetical protein B0H14DRAFT_2612991 [Mycena olivaceomarginata]|nr:hypothetical protein B0H14DRAFT_2612991 [Mycena olivaceomarginata]